MPIRPLVVYTAMALMAGPLVPPDRDAGRAPAAIRSQSDLDDFMARVLETRDENWKKVQQYILDERELVRVKGPAAVPVYGERREYTWYIEDGYFVRSPVSANGVTIPEDERRQYEARYLRQAKARDQRERERAARRAEEAGEGAGAPATGEPPAASTGAAEPDVEGLIAQTEQPRFIDSAYFLEFKFEQGRYALVGREVFDGRDVLRIEYYPEQLFSDEDDRRQRQQPQREQDLEATIERLMNKVSMVTLWIEPESHQIVKYTFDNLNFDFLPVAWLVRVDEVRASMTMTQPFPDVWLPQGVDMHFSAMLAIGDFSVDYQLDYENYRRAETSGRIIGVTIGRGRGGGGGGAR